MKKILPIILIIVILCSCTKAKDTIGTATVSIECKTILQNLDKLDEGVKKVLPADGVILPETEIELYEGDNIYSVINRLSKAEKIVLNVKGDSYLVGINGISEFSCGDLSGWKYKVNGEFSSKSISQHEVAPNDKIEFLYTCNLGDDLE